MVTKTGATKYEKVKFPQELLDYFEMIMDTSKGDKSSTVIKIKDVLELIIKKTPNPQNPEKDVYGITKSDIERELNISRHVGTEVLGVLAGGTLIQYEEVKERGKYWTATSRGMQVMMHLRVKQGQKSKV